MSRGPDKPVDYGHIMAADQRTHGSEPLPAPIKPPRRMLQPRKDQLRERIAALESQLDEATHTIAAMNAETEAAREAFQRLWAETRPKRGGTLIWLQIIGALWRSIWDRPKAGGLTSFEIHDRPSTEEALRVASQRLGERAARSMPTEEMRYEFERLHRFNSQVAPDPDHPQGSSDGQAQGETAPDHDQHRTESGHDAPAVDVEHDPPSVGIPHGTPEGH